MLLAAVLIWGALARLTPITWTALAGIVLVPASLIAALVELKPRGRTPLFWVSVFARRARRPHLLIATRTMGLSNQGPGTRMRRVAHRQR